MYDCDACIKTSRGSRGYTVCAECLASAKRMNAMEKSEEDIPEVKAIMDRAYAAALAACERKLAKHYREIADTHDKIAEVYEREAQRPVGPEPDAQSPVESVVKQVT